MQFSTVRTRRHAPRWIQRKCWADAEAAFADLIRARPHLIRARVERGRFYVMRSELEKAADDFARALALGERDSKLFAEIVSAERVFDHVVTLLLADEIALASELLFLRADRLAKEGRLDSTCSLLARVASMSWKEASPVTGRLKPGQMFATMGFPEQVRSLFDKHEQTTNAHQANNVAWYCCSLLLRSPNPMPL